MFRPFTTRRASNTTSSANRPSKQIEWIFTDNIGAPGRNRTCDLALRRHSLYPLSYRGREPAGRSEDSGPGFGGGEGDRTLDLRIANATLSQLSYSPGKGPGILAAKAPNAKVSRVDGP